MEITVITMPGSYDGECGLACSMFDAGLKRLHLRKPGWSRQELESWLQNIPERYHRRIVLHDCFELASLYGIGGIHLNGRNPEVPQSLKSRISSESLSVSHSCHSLTELAGWKDRCSYLFLSPIYDSISKEGYGRAFSRKELEESGLIDDKVYALGGVSADKIPELNEIGFGGAAVLGYVWQSSDPIAKLKLLGCCKVV